ncbi:cytochrome P450 [Fistulina hepatica ATCC 64428]|uniref:Cytochrome P450 n=1 Tax=Fistulina hepatica ATCC 64428 TaxID=1128425 RepID=A0A0D7ADD8_9AGAR|nr:cytochrome P450 [Fistulina hepatica ATCC 64428]
MSTITIFLETLFFGAVLYALVSVLRYRRSSLPIIPGPPNPGWPFGHFRQIISQEHSVLQEQWTKTYGPTIKFDMLFGVRIATRFYLSHIANMRLRPLAICLLVTEGPKHAHQRRVMSPAFGISHIRELTEVFLDYSIKVKEFETESSKGKQMPVNIFSWLNRVTLDIIGKAGFKYEFNALDNADNELNNSLVAALKMTPIFHFTYLLRLYFPILRFLPGGNITAERHYRATVSRIGKELLHDARASAAKEDMKDSHTRDLLSLLVRVNSHARTQMPEEDILAQIPTFVVAGHETTSTAVTWSLFALGQAPEIQARLRAEVRAMTTARPTMEELNALPYLDRVVRETLRMYPPVPAVERIATRDDVVPLSHPIIDSAGVRHYELKIPCGTYFTVPILAVNRDPDIWGSDAGEFRPDRWDAVPEAVKNIPGVWGNMMTFIGGQHACIGYRFSLIETKAILFTLLRSFEFELAVSADDIVKKSTIVTRPVLRGEPKAGAQLPMLIKPVH